MLEYGETVKSTLPALVGVAGLFTLGALKPRATARYKHGPALGDYVAAALLKGAAIDPRFSLAAKPVIESGGRSSTIRAAH